MDKYEYRIMADKIKELVEKKEYVAAMEIADSINWRRVRNVSMLCMVSEIYEKNERYEDSYEILLIAYERSPIGRMIIYKLVEACLLLNNHSEAIDFYKEFVKVAPHDSGRYILKYKICKAKGSDPKELISILETLKKKEYYEEWAYELANLYHQEGMESKCIEECDELILWFNEGKYVENALELKMLYQPLTKSQQEKYSQSSTFQADSDLNGMEKDPEEMQSPKPEINMIFGTERKQKEKQMSFIMKKEEQGISESKREPLSDNRFETANLQAELAKSMYKIINAGAKEIVEGTINNIRKMVEESQIKGLVQETALRGAQNAEKGQSSDENGFEEEQIEGQINLEDIFAEINTEKKPGIEAQAVTRHRELKKAKTKALQETRELMQRLADSIPKIEADEEVEYPDETGYSDFMDRLDESAIEEEDIEIITEHAAYIGEPEYPGEFSLEEQEYAEEAAEPESMEEQEYAEEAAEPESMEEQEYAEEAAEPESMEEQEYAGEAAETKEEEYFADDYLLNQELEKESESESDIELTPESVEELDQKEETLVSEEDIYPDETAYEDIQLAEKEWEVGEEEDELNSSEEAINTETDDYAEEIDVDFREDLIPDKGAEELVAESSTDEARNAMEEPQETEEDRKQQLIEIKEEALERFRKKEFADYKFMKDLDKQLDYLFDAGMDFDARINQLGRGNFVIMGDPGTGKTTLAMSIVKFFEKEKDRKAGKVAKITGDSLNSRDMQAIFKKLFGGVLLIEQAGSLSEKTVLDLKALMDKRSYDVIVVLEDDSRAMENFFMKYPEFETWFSKKIIIPRYTNDELVEFGKNYAAKLNYCIDDIGVLALYTRIGKIQKEDVSTTLAEVKEIIDGAIAGPRHRGIRKLIGKISPRQRNNSNMVVLQEKDFEE